MRLHRLQRDWELMNSLSYGRTGAEAQQQMRSLRATQLTNFPSHEGRTRRSLAARRPLLLLLLLLHRIASHRCCCSRWSCACSSCNQHSFLLLLLCRLSSRHQRAAAARLHRSLSSHPPLGLLLVINSSVSFSPQRLLPRIAASTDRSVAKLSTRLPSPASLAAALLFLALFWHSPSVSHSPVLPSLSSPR
jgi:hypothetical protein